MPSPPQPGTAAPPRVTQARAVFGALILGILQFGAWYSLLDQAHRDAELQAIAHVARDTDIVRERVERHIEALARYHMPLESRVQARLEGRMTEGFAERRINRLVGTNSAAVVHVLFLARNPADDWEVGTIAAPYDSATRDTLRTAPIPAGAIVFDPPIHRPAANTWLLPTRHAITNEDGAFAGIAVLAIDGSLFAASLSPHAAVSPEEHVALRRDDGLFLAGTADAVSRIARRDTASRPAADGRISDSRRGPDRFIAARAVSGQSLFVTVSAHADRELAAFAELRDIAILLEIVVLLALSGTATALFFHSAHRQSEAAAARARERQAALHHILDGVGAGVFRLKMGLDGTVNRYDFNSGTARLLHRSMDEIAGASVILDYAEPPATTAERRRVAADLHHTGSAIHEHQFRCGDGALRWMRLHVRVVARDGDTFDCVALMTDIETEKSAIASAVSSARLAALGEVSSSIAHEMMQPLTVIALLAETSLAMLAEPRPDDLPQLAAQQEKIVEMTRRARLVTDHLRRAARTVGSARTLIPLRSVVDGALMMGGSALRAANIKLDIDLPADLPPIFGSSELFEQVFLNLLLNARDAIVESEPAERRIIIAAHTQPAQTQLAETPHAETPLAETPLDRVIVTVTDTGPGIPPAILGRMFERFFTTKSADRGTGLGLSICAGILAAAGGTIAATNAPPTKPGRGAEFVITLRTTALPATQQAA